ncbi:hypothetical protein BDR03DRAFT_964611, partial [Suillus americanus]
MMVYVYIQRSFNAFLQAFFPIDTADIPYACWSESFVFALYGLFLQLFVSELKRKHWMLALFNPSL